jgi:DNA-binding transcriptional regulator YdaS (Cro superfamily)
VKQACEALQKHIDWVYAGSASKFARTTGLDQSDLSKLLRGVRKSISVEYAARIEVATKGAVPIALWSKP